MDLNFTRRQLLQTAALAVAGVAPSVVRSAPTAKPGRPTLGFSLYGLASLPLDEALQLCADTGYDDVEPALMPGFHADPAELNADRRRALRNKLTSLGLGLPALMDSLGMLGPVESHRKNLERLAEIAELAHDVAVGPTPVLETILGGKPAEWNDVRETMVDRLRDWAVICRKHDLVVAVKPHVAHALHLPEDAVWLVDAVDSPHVRLAYDYSHYQAQGLALEATLDALQSRTVFIHVKDGRLNKGVVEFLLPGEGTTDYAAYFRRLAATGYNGSVTVEVSSRLHKRPDYDPHAAVRRSYQALAAAWDRAGLPPRSK